MVRLASLNQIDNAYLLRALTVSFCADLRSRSIEFRNLQRLSFLTHVNQDILSDEDIILYAPLAALVGWIKAVDAREHLQEFHLCEVDHVVMIETGDEKGIVDRVIMPALLDLQIYLTRDERRKPPRVKISVNCRLEESLALIKVGMARLEKSGLEVNGIGESICILALCNAHDGLEEQYLCSSNVLGSRRISLDTFDASD